MQLNPFSSFSKELFKSNFYVNLTSGYKLAFALWVMVNLAQSVLVNYGLISLDSVVSKVLARGMGSFLVISALAINYNFPIYWPDERGFSAKILSISKNIIFSPLLLGISCYYFSYSFLSPHGALANLLCILSSNFVSNNIINYIHSLDAHNLINHREPSYSSYYTSLKEYFLPKQTEPARVPSQRRRRPSTVSFADGPHPGDNEELGAIIHDNGAGVGFISLASASNGGGVAKTTSTPAIAGAAFLSPTAGIAKQSPLKTQAELEALYQGVRPELLEIVDKICSDNHHIWKGLRREIKDLILGQASDIHSKRKAGSRASDIAEREERHKRAVGHSLDEKYITSKRGSHAASPVLAPIDDFDDQAGMGDGSGHAINAGEGAPEPPAIIPQRLSFASKRARAGSPSQNRNLGTPARSRISTGSFASHMSTRPEDIASPDPFEFDSSDSPVVKGTKFAVPPAPHKPANQLSRLGGAIARAAKSAATAVINALSPRPKPAPAKASAPAPVAAAPAPASAIAGHVTKAASLAAPTGASSSALAGGGAASGASRARAGSTASSSFTASTAASRAKAPAPAPVAAKIGAVGAPASRARAGSVASAASAVTHVSKLAASSIANAASVAGGGGGAVRVKGSKLDIVGAAPAPAPASKRARAGSTSTSTQPLARR